MSAAEVMVRGRAFGIAEPSRGVRNEAWAPVLLGAMAGSLIASRIETVTLCAAAAVLGAVWIRAGWPRARWTSMLATSMAIAFVLNLYLVHGQTVRLPHLFGVAPTREGARLGLLLALRLFGASIAFHGLAKLWPGERAAEELLRPLRPLSRFGLAVEDSREVLALALRFMPLLTQEARRIARVQTLRAGRPPHGASERLTRMRATLIPSLVAAIERAEQLALTLEARHHRARSWPARRPFRGGAFVGLGLFVTALLWRA